MSWGYLEDASGVQGHADRICIPPDEATLLALLAEAHTARVPITIAGGDPAATARDSDGHPRRMGLGQQRQ